MIVESLRSIYTTNLGVKQGEKVLVFTDLPGPATPGDAAECCRLERLRYLALLAAEVGRSCTKKISYVEYPSRATHGTEPPEELWTAAFGAKTVKALRTTRLLKPLLAKTLDDGEFAAVQKIVQHYRASAVNAVIALSNYSTSHTRFRHLLTGLCGCRYASMPLFDVSMLEGAMLVDWKALAKRTRALAALMNKGVTVSLTTPNGTSLSFSMRTRKALADTGILTRPGSFGNLPAGEVFVAPLEGTANGTLVIEWGPTHALAHPLTLSVADGRVIRITGKDPYAAVLRAKLEERSDNANIAEFGIGTNPRARRPDNILESEKILGTVHVALGDNSSFGGSVRTPFHQDFVFFKPTVTLTPPKGKAVPILDRGIPRF
jgi:leucyl aminopeptidase (aminopeptidase T)